MRIARALVTMLGGDGRPFAWAWLRSFRSDWLIRQQRPWLTFPATAELERRLAGRDGLRVFEFGSGGSTLFWLSLGASVVSVEHDPRWHERLRRVLPVAASVDYRLVPPEPALAAGEISDPAAFASDDPAYRSMSFERYTRVVDEFDDGAFDVVLVDGRARPSCLQRAIPKVSPGGLLVLDNAERSYYTAQVRGLEPFEHLVFEGHHPGLTELGRTDIYVKR